MRSYRVLFWIEVVAVDKGEAEKKAKGVLKKKKIDATLYSIEEA